ncbi:MAG TPA: enamine deaminase RidA, partial [Sutterella sp.]|nr:enamine deaminase RidA [Sutterella sp.]
MEFVYPDFKGKNPGHYSAAVKVGGLMYVSGQLSINPDTRQVCQGDIREHT